MRPEHRAQDVMDLLRTTPMSRRYTHDQVARVTRALERFEGSVTPARVANEIMRLDAAALPWHTPEDIIAGHVADIAIDTRSDPGPDPIASSSGTVVDGTSVTDMARRPGRPGWTHDQFWRHYREAEDETPEPKTQVRIAEHFVRLDHTPGVDPDYLRELRRRFSTG